MSEEGAPAAEGVRPGALQVTRLEPEFVAAAIGRLPAADSARAGAALWQRVVLIGLAAGIAALIVFDPGRALEVGLAALSILVSATALLRVAALLAARPWPRRSPAPVLEDAPTAALIVALRREAATLPALLEALGAQRYPAGRLRVALALEADDPETLAALEALYGPEGSAAPAWLEVVVAPDGRPKTKPRALNAAWAHLERSGARPEIIGVLDAEDRPEPELVARAAAALSGAPERVAAVQARLGYYNARETWLSRCFAIEYAIWFDVTLKGLNRIGAPLPLGGSSVFFRTAALERLGGWDAHNVTEDADLGLRLARAGYGYALIDATTLEEAASRPTAWVRQRSRWLKGFLQTWMSVSRRPVEAVRAYGLYRFAIAQILLLGGPATALAQPLVWGAAIAVLLGVDLGWAGALGPLGPVLIGALIIGQAALLASALIGLARTRQLGLAAWCLTLPLYWPLAAIAAYKALIELFVAPFYWDKTRHGVGAAAQTLRAEALARWPGGGSAADRDSGGAIRPPSRSQ